MSTAAADAFKIIVTLPAYNEEENIGALLENIS